LLVEARPRFPEDVFDEPAPGDELRTDRLPAVPGRTGPGPGAGVGLCFLLHVLQFPLGAVWPYAAFFIGFSQYTYVLPAIVIAAVLGRGGISRGLALGSLLTILLNIACFGVVCGGISPGG